MPRSRVVSHRWRLPVGDEPAQRPGDFLVGAVGQWEIRAIEPVDSPVHPNDFRVTLRRVSSLDELIDAVDVEDDDGDRGSVWWYEKGGPRWTRFLLDRAARFAMEATGGG